MPVNDDKVFRLMALVVVVTVVWKLYSLTRAVGQVNVETSERVMQWLIDAIECDIRNDSGGRSTATPSLPTTSLATPSLASIIACVGAAKLCAIYTI
jgi:hypothetical protein